MVESKKKATTVAKKTGSKRIKVPPSPGDLLKLFTLSRTNQIRRGRSPVIEDQDDKTKDWTELMASEIYSAKVSVVAKPLEYNVGIVSSDPRSGRYQKKETQAHLCKAVRKNIITNIIRKYHLVESRVDNGRGRRKTTKKDLEAWKMRRAQGLEGWKRKKKKRRKKVISSKGKKKKFQQYKGCTTCGDYHFKRVCAANDLKINLLVRQINQKTDMIKEYMSDAWSKLDSLEATYNNMFMKTQKIQSNRVCLDILTGEPNDGHPHSCPCAAQKKKEEEIEKAKKREEERKQKEVQEKMEQERARKEELLKKRKERFYRSLKKVEEKVIKEKTEVRQKLEQLTQDVTKLDRDFKTTRTPEKVVSRKSSKGTLDAISEDLRSAVETSGRHLDLILMDGAVKTLTSEWVEEGGRVMESLRVDSIPDDLIPKEPTIQEEPESIKVIEKSDGAEDDLETLGDDIEDIPAEDGSKPKIRDSIPFDKFLDYMELF